MESHCTVELGRVRVLTYHICVVIFAGAAHRVGPDSNYILCMYVYGAVCVCVCVCVCLYVCVSV